MSAIDNPKFIEAVGTVLGAEYVPASEAVDDNEHSWSKVAVHQRTEVVRQEEQTDSDYNQTVIVQAIADTWGPMNPPRPLAGWSIELASNQLMLKFPRKKK